MFERATPKTQQKKREKKKEKGGEGEPVTSGTVYEGQRVEEGGGGGQE